jgi:ElaB/YqjD/DUF883 family membrane-anchored ribosome-binding protein
MDAAAELTPEAEREKPQQHLGTRFASRCGSGLGGGTAASAFNEGDAKMATTGTQGSAWQDTGTIASGGNSGRASSVSENAAATVDKIATGAHQAVDRIASAATSAASQLGVKGDEVLEAKERVMDSMREYVRAKPLAALGIALAAGFVISRIMR